MCGLTRMKMSAEETEEERRERGRVLRRVRICSSSSNEGRAAAAAGRNSSGAAEPTFLVEAARAAHDVQGGLAESIGRRKARTQHQGGGDE